MKCGLSFSSATRMTKPDLTDEDYTDLAGLVRVAIDTERIRVGPRINKLRLLLAKADAGRRKGPIAPLGG
jgi:hypothetical protein